VAALVESLQTAVRHFDVTSFANQARRNGRKSATCITFRVGPPLAPIVIARDGASSSVGAAHAPVLRRVPTLRLGYGCQGSREKASATSAQRAVRHPNRDRDNDRRHARPERMRFPSGPDGGRPRREVLGLV